VGGGSSSRPRREGAEEGARSEQEVTAGCLPGRQSQTFFLLENREEKKEEGKRKKKMKVEKVGKK